MKNFQTVLFDLDGTLLPMDQDHFVKVYFGLLAKWMAPYGYDPDRLIKAVWKGTEAMVGNDGSRLNEVCFWESFKKAFNLSSEERPREFNEFYEKEFPKVRQAVGCQPKAAETVRQLKSEGKQLILATNPIFPAIATRQRVRWAGLDETDFDWITTYENSTFCKPNPDYYTEILNRFGLNAADCLMVGNDAEEDTAALQAGLSVFLLTDDLINRGNRNLDSIPHGSYEELWAYLDMKKPVG